MGNKIRPFVIAANLLAILAIIAVQAWDRESTLSEGVLALFPLAPMDPRSLMQGDFMRLRHDEPEMPLDDTGFLVCTVDENRVAKPVESRRSIEGLDWPRELAIKYTSVDGSISFGTDTFFFKEGTSFEYAMAKYAGYIVTRDGNSQLSGLYDKECRRLGPAN